MDNRDQIFQEILFKIIKVVNDINYNIITKKIDSLVEIKKIFLYLKKTIDADIPKDLTIIHEGKEVNCLKELYEEIEKLYAVCLRVFRSFSWGDFAILNPKKFPELHSMLIDKNGDILRTFDDFQGTLAVMDFHGYTKFSNEIKYNKTPLHEFGNILPRKIEHICTLCKTIVYEMEGDALILVGPDNPVYITQAVLCIIELARQKQFNPNINPKSFHGIEISNPMIKPFEMNAAITTGGETFINKKGNIIGTIISEASRMLKVINEKQPEKSGVVLSEKVYRKMEKCKNTQSSCHLPVFDFKFSNPLLLDVKGMRLNIRELYIGNKEYTKGIEENFEILNEEIRKKNPSKWFNILPVYVRLINSVLYKSKCVMQIDGEEMNQDRIKTFLDEKIYEWVKEPTPALIRDILKISNQLFMNVEEIRDVTAVFHHLIQDNFTLIAEKLEQYYAEHLKYEENNNPSLRKLVESYNSEMKKIKSRIIPRRIFETVLMDQKFSEKLLNVPYFGKK